LVVFAVIHEGDYKFGMRLPVNGQSVSPIGGGSLVNLDVVRRCAVTIVEFAGLPVGRESGIEAELIDFKVQAEQRLGDESVKPAG